jgi:hypothetical protein
VSLNVEARQSTVCTQRKAVWLEHAGHLLLHLLSILIKETLCSQADVWSLLQVELLVLKLMEGVSMLGPQQAHGNASCMLQTRSGSQSALCDPFNASVTTADLSHTTVAPLRPVSYGIVH